MAKNNVPVMLFCTGLNNVEDPARVVFEEGKAALTIAVNIDIDKSGMIHRRRGYTRQVAGNFHSLWSDGRHCYVIQEHETQAALYQVDPSFGITGIRSGLSKHRPMSFVSIGDLTFYTNRFQSGVIKYGASSPWLADHDYEGPLGVSSEEASDLWNPITDVQTEIEHDGERWILEDAIDTRATPGEGHNIVYSFPPTGGSFLEVSGGYLLMVVRDTVFFSCPNLPFYWRYATDWKTFESEITMLAAVDDGCYVGTLDGTYFCHGLDPHSWTVRKVSETSPVPYSLNPETLWTGPEQGDARIWWSNHGASGERGGLCWGLNSGNYINLTEPKIVTKPAAIGASAIIQDKVVTTCAGSLTDTNWLALSTNVRINATTQYTNFPFNSFANYNDHTLGASSSGIYLLEIPGDDNGTDIDARFRIARTNFNLFNQLRIQYLLTSMRGETDGSYQYRLYDDEQNERIRTITPIYGALRHHVCRTNIGRDGVGNEWDIEFRNIDGADFDIDRIEAAVTPLNRWPRNFVS